MKQLHGVWSLALAGALSMALPAEARPSASPPAAANPGLLTLVRTDRTMPVSGDPIWELQLMLPGQRLWAYEALVGKARHQNADRDQLGTQAPLPRGSYTVTEIAPIEQEDPRELGRFIWIGLEPTFSTGRRALGIHHDPSAGRGRASGTNGCIGLIHGNDLLVLGDLLRRSGTKELVVQD